MLFSYVRRHYNFGPQSDASAEEHAAAPPIFSTPENLGTDSEHVDDTPRSPDATL